MKAETIPGVAEAFKQWRTGLASAKLQSVEPFDIRKERRREEDKTMIFEFVRTKRADVPVTMSVTLQHAVRDHVEQLSLVISGIRHKVAFGADPLKPLLGAVRASALPDAEQLMAAGKAMKQAGRLVGSSPFRILLMAAQELGSKVVGQAEEVANVLQDHTCYKLVLSGVPFNELPMPGLPEEILAMLQEAARAAVFSEAINECRGDVKKRMSYRRYSALANLYMSQAFGLFWSDPACAAYD